MYTRAYKIQKNKGQSVTKGISQKRSKGGISFQLLDNRPEAILQKKLHKMVNKSPQGRHLSAFQEMANNSVQMKSNFQFHNKAFPIQLVADPNSDPILLAHYNFLMNSATFQDLDNRITMNGAKPVNLVDGTVGQNISYNAETHTISVPLRDDQGSAHPNDQIRGDILWEMHNAQNKGAIKRANTKYPEQLPANAKIDEKKERQYKKANYALTVEWIEWSKVLEQVIRERKINAELPGGAPSPRVQDQFGANYAVPDAGWYLFENYLNDMRSWHTTSYDEDANNPKWLGIRILKVAIQKHKASLKITKNAEQDFRLGTKKSIKDEGLNPFRAESVWKEAAWRD